MTRVRRSFPSSLGVTSIRHSATRRPRSPSLGGVRRSTTGGTVAAGFFIGVRNAVMLPWPSMIFLLGFFVGEMKGETVADRDPPPPPVPPRTRRPARG